MLIDELFDNQVASLLNSEPCVHQWFEYVAGSFPDRIAIRETEKSITYFELNARANRVAHYLLQKLPTGYQNPICIFAPASISFVVAKLAILKAGCAYVPLDIKYPLERVESVLLQTDSPLLFINPDTKGRFEDISVEQVNIDLESQFADFPATNPNLALSWNQLAYIIFTSGSTGEPKGVMVAHRNLVHLINWGLHKFSMQGGENAAQTARVVFDASIWEFWSSLLCGNTLHLLDLATLLDMEKCNAWLIARQIHYLFMPTPIGELFLDSDWHHNAHLKHLMVGGERLMKRPHPDFPAILTNVYGPTETTVMVTTKAVESENLLHINPSIGTPVENCLIYLLDEHLKPVKAGDTGEIYIGGALVGPGYWKREDLTEKAFLPDPFCSESGAIMYKTGDTARWYPDGDLDYVGRIDFQVKIRGFRIELGEIETVLLHHPAVNSCIVNAVEVSAGTTSLAAYIILKQDMEVSITELRALAVSKLPDYMIPDYYEFMAAFPLTNNGKTDRKALPIPIIADKPTQELIQPQTELEIQVAGIWKDVLKVDELSMTDRFYDLGGHSLKATQIISQFRKKLSISVDIVFMLGNPSLAQTVAEIQSTSQSEQQTIPANIDLRTYPLSWAQHGMWYYWQLNPQRVDYNIAFRIDIRGDLDVSALQKALDITVERHNTFHTRFIMQDGIPVAEVLPPKPIDFEIVRISEAPSKLLPSAPGNQHNDLFPYPVESNELDYIKERMGNIHFNLNAGYLIQACLVDCTSENYVLFLTIHHIVTDGWSMGVFIRDLRIAYTAIRNGSVPSFEKQSINYGDYALWQKSAEPMNRFPRQLEYWKQKLLPVPPPQSFLHGVPEKIAATTPGKRIWWRVDAACTARIKALTKQRGKSQYSFLLSIYKILLYHYFQENDIVVGSSFAGRQVSETENLVGIFTNLFAIRTWIDGALSFEALWQSVQDNSAHAFANADYPFDQLVTDLGYKSQFTHHILLNHVFILQNFPLDLTEFSGLHLRMMEIGNQTSKFDLLLTVEEWHEDLVCWFEYNPEIISEQLALALSRQYQWLCEQILANPDSPVDEYEILLPAEKDRILLDWNATAADYPLDKNYIELFQASVRQFSDNVAVVYETQQLTYAELDALSDKLAAELSARGVKHRDSVGVALERSLYLPVSLLAIWKAGAAYLPLDMAFPEERLKYMLETASVRLVVTETAHTAALHKFAELLCLDDNHNDWQKRPATTPVNLLQPDDVAYIIYTSGSTGIPKGVMISHRNLINHNLAVIDAFRLTPADRVMQFGSISFDLSAEEIFPTWLCGATLVLRNEQVLNSLDSFLDFSERQCISVIDIPTAYWHELVLLLEKRKLPLSIRLCIIGGEKAQADKLKLWQQNTAPEVRLLNTYGPTETTIIATIFEPTSASNADSSIFPIGKPIANVQTYILDSRLKPVPIGAAGELYIAGAGVGIGYLANPGLTAERFVPCPFGADPAAMMYRTGDIVTYDADGNIIFIGRKDAQVKLLGHRIELSEIELHLGQLDAVKSAAVVLVNSDPNHQFLCAYVVPATSHPEVEVIASQLRTRLPDYMVPAAIMFIDKLPLTPQGKVNKRALPSPSFSLETKAAVAPRTPMEQTIAQIWMKVLSLPAVDINTSFRELGGHSLKAMLTVSLLEKELQVSLGLKEFLAHPTIQSLAGFLQQKKPATAQEAIRNLVPVKRAAPTYPLSFAQEGLWFLWELDDSKISYNIPMVYYIDGYLDPEVMNHTWQILFSRHEIFRTRFTINESTPQVSLDFIPPTSIEQIDLTDKPESLARAFALKMQKTTAATVFDLTTGPLYAVKLLKLADDQWQLILVVHHIIADGWSIAVLSRELKDIYTSLISAQPVALPQVNVQSIDYSVWQRNEQDRGLLQSQSEYWKSNLLPIPEPLNLPCRSLRPAFQTYRGSQIRFEVDSEDLQRWNQLCQQTDASLFMLLTAGLSLLYYKYCHQTDIVIGTPFANRKDPQLENVVGCFTNMLALRTMPDAEEDFSSFLQNIKSTCLEAYSHSEYPFYLLPGLLNLPRDASRHPLYQIMLTLQNYAIPQLDFAGLNISTDVIGNGSAKLDMSWDFSQTDNVLTGVLEYNSDLYDSAFCQGLTQNLVVLLNNACSSPEQKLSLLPCISPVEYRQQITELNATAQSLPPYQTVSAWIDAQCNQTPGADAVVFAGQTYTYRQLQQRVHAASSVLNSHSIQPGEVVGLYLERSADMLIAALACWSVRAAYLYLDPDFPPERLAFMVEDSQLKQIITDKPLPEAMGKLNSLTIELKALSTEPEVPVESFIKQTGLAEDIAYIIFTSGSTGKPKAVQISQLSVVNFLASMQQQPGLVASDTLAAITPMSFDISVLELFLPLVTGARLLILPPAAALDAMLLSRLLQEEAVTVFQATPSTYKMLLDSGWEGKPDLKALCGGEALSKSLAQALLPRVHQLWNMYGPTETTVWSAIYQITDAEQPILIGKPIANTSIYILNESLQPVPLGVWGELYIGGLGVSPGYFNRPELTASRFISNPFIGAVASSPVSGAELSHTRLYKTGDLVRYTPEGILEYGGRNDFQVKIRGHRIEPDEIASLLRHHPAIKDAIVTVKDRDPETQVLVAYLILHPAQKATAGDLQSFLSRDLPDYMIPTSYVFLEQFPLTANGKIDLKQLLLVDSQHSVPEKECILPFTPEQEILCKAVSEVLNLPVVSLADNFFALGGNSILTMKLISLIHKSGLNVTVDHLFRHRNLEELAGKLQIRLAQTHTFGSESLILLQKGKTGSIPLFLVHPLPGDVLGYVNLVQQLSPDITVYGIQSLGLTDPQKAHTRITDMAAYYLNIIKELGIPKFYLGGWCFGGSIAIEMAYQANKIFDLIPRVFLFDTWAFNPVQELYLKYQIHRGKTICFNWRRIPSLVLTKCKERRGFQVIFDRENIFQDQGIFENRSLVRKTNLNSLWTWKMHKYNCPVVLIRAKEQHPDTIHDWTLGWTVFAEKLTVYPIEATHDNILKQPQVKRVAEIMSKYL